ncbi:MAG: hypothetical protein WDN03_04045 [Rhizomicrobium sp.]
MQHRAYTILRAFLCWAHRKHYLDRNPMERMQAPPASAPRDRILTDDELKRVWLAAGDDTYGRIIKLLILTGQRRGEIAGLTGSMVGTDAITFPTGYAKNGRQHVLPLGAMAKEALGRERSGGDLYFPARGRKTPYNGFSKSKAELDARCGFDDWTVHDLAAHVRVRPCVPGRAASGDRAAAEPCLGQFRRDRGRVSALRLYAGDAGRRGAVGTACA